MVDDGGHLTVQISVVSGQALELFLKAFEPGFQSTVISIGAGIVIHRIKLRALREGCL